MSEEHVIDLVTQYLLLGQLIDQETDPQRRERLIAQVEMSIKPALYEAQHQSWSDLLLYDYDPDFHRE
jgi:hypothetical protein